MAGEYAFVMKDLRKVVPPKREILRGIWLSFFHGAKIGVLGANGAGKSSLLRIMAGVDPDFLGEAFPAAGLRIGYLPQEPQLDPAKDVRGNVEEGVAETRALLTRFEAVSARLGEPLEADEMEKLLEEQGRREDRIDAANAWDLDRTIELAMDALRVPPGEMDVAKISGGERRRVALCRLLLSRPDMLLLDEPTNHLDTESVAWLERFLKEYPGTVVAVTHDRYFLDNVAGWILELDRGHGIPWEGNYSSWLGQKQERLQRGGEDRGPAPPRRARAARLRGPEPRRPRWEEDGLGGDLRGCRHAQPGRPDAPVTRLRRVVQLQGERPAEAGRRAVRRRAQPAPPRQDPQARRQPDPARRADERPRRGHAARAGRRARRLRRLRARDHPRSLVPRPHRHPHPRVRGRRQGRVVRGQLRRLRGRPPQAPRRRGRAAPPPQVQAPAARLSGRWQHTSTFSPPGRTRRRRTSAKSGRSAAARPRAPARRWRVMPR